MKIMILLELDCLVCYRCRVLVLYSSADAAEASAREITQKAEKASVKKMGGASSSNLQPVIQIIYRLTLGGNVAQSTTHDAHRRAGVYSRRPTPTTR